MNLRFDYWTPPGWGTTVLRRAVAVGHEQDLANRYNIYLCGVLTFDYHSPDGCDRMLQEIERVERGEIETGVGSGNAWTKTFTRRGVQIDSHTVPEWDESLDGYFSLAEFKVALEGWKRFLQMPPHRESYLEVTLPETKAS